MIGLHFWRTKEGEEVDFLVELHAATGQRWLGIEAKLGIQSVEPLAIPHALSHALPTLREIWTSPRAERNSDCRTHRGSCRSACLLSA
jgi:hypothetical protein